MRSGLLYAASCVIAIALIGAVAWAFTDAAGQQTILVSAAIALGVQLTAFTMARLLQPRHLLLGWGLGSVLRLVVLVIYAVVVARLWRAPLTPALLSFVGFLFVTTVFEPVFLKR
jgi:hypothetical protein